MRIAKAQYQAFFFAIALIGDSLQPKHIIGHTTLEDGVPEVAKANKGRDSDHEIHDATLPLFHQDPKKEYSQRYLKEDRVLLNVSVESCIIVDLPKYRALRPQ
jgi:hypothetical protein